MTVKYMLLIYHDEPSWNAVPENERQQIYLEYGKLRPAIAAVHAYIKRNSILYSQTPRRVLCSRNKSSSAMRSR